MIDAVIVMTHKESGSVRLPHVEHMAQSNPVTPIYIMVGEDSPGGKRQSWKNSDRELRKWWRTNHHKVVGDTLFVCEWDTLVSCQLPELPANLDLASRHCFHQPPRRHPSRRTGHPDWSPANWMWWGEVPRLGLPDGCRGVGLVSFGAYFMRRTVLDEVVSPRWDDAYARPIQNELRFPSIAAAAGFRVGELDLPFMEFDDVPVTTRRGIYHSVDSPVEINRWNNE